MAKKSKGRKPEQPPRHRHGRDERDQNRDDWDELDESSDLARLGALVGMDAEELRQLSAALGDSFEIVELDDESEEWEDFPAPVQPTASFDQLLHRLLHTPDLPSLGELFALSDLSRQDAETLRREWEQIPVVQRRAVVTELVSRAEEQFGLMLGRFLRIALTDPDAETRAAAVRGLWEDDDPDLIGPLVQMMHNDPSVPVRAAAATGLGGFVFAGELEELDSALAMRAEEALLAVLADESVPLEVRRRALESIAFSGEAGVRQLIEDAYYAPDEPMRVSALFAMGRSADIRWRPLVRAELQNPSAAMRAEAAVACGELEAKSALNDLLALLNDREPAVRLAAIFALGRIGGEDARDALETVILGDNPDEVEAAEQALEEMQFYDQVNAISLFDESEDEEEEWDADPADEWYDLDERELGEYEPDADDYLDDDLDDAKDA
jgi:HEAT repeat protein